MLLLTNSSKWFEDHLTPNILGKKKAFKEDIALSFYEPITYNNRMYAPNKNSALTAVRNKIAFQSFLTEKGIPTAGTIHKGSSLITMNDGVTLFNEGVIGMRNLSRDCDIESFEEAVTMRDDYFGHSFNGLNLIRIQFAYESKINASMLSGNVDVKACIELAKAVAEKLALAYVSVDVLFDEKPYVFDVDSNRIPEEIRDSLAGKILDHYEDWKVQQRKR